MFFSYQHSVYMIYRRADKLLHFTVHWGVGTTDNVYRGNKLFNTTPFIEKQRHQLQLPVCVFVCMYNLQSRCDLQTDSGWDYSHNIGCSLQICAYSMIDSSVTEQIWVVQYQTQQPPLFRILHQNGKTVTLFPHRVATKVILPKITFMHQKHIFKVISPYIQIK